MGCVQTRPSSGSPHHGDGKQKSLDKLKLANGYTSKTAAPPKRSFSRDPALPVGPRRSFRSVNGGSERARGVGRYPSSKRNTKNDGREKKDGAGQGVKVENEKAEAAVRPKAKLTEEAMADGEMVDGWPKWLTNNIPPEVLAGLVPRSADSYDKLCKVGQGTYSNVYKARDRETKKIVALKKVRFDTTEPESIRFMAREIMILQRLDHPNVIKLEGLATSRMHYSLYLVFEFMHSDLARVICHPEGRLTEPQVKCYMNQLLSGLRHCHKRGILHRDIKGSNLLIDKEGVLKIADFGLANYFNPNKKRPLTSRVVTLWYRAPELLLGATDYGVGIDLWSAGCLLAEMFAGKPIMPGRTEVEQLHRIFKLCGSPSEDYWKKLRISTSFRPPQPYRPNIAETFQDFPASSLGLLKILLALDPPCRGSAASALENEFFSSSPLACDLSGLPVIYKPEDDESTRSLERRRRRSSRLKQHSRTLKEGQRKVAQEITMDEIGDYELIETQGKHHDPSSDAEQSNHNGMHPPRYSVSIPPSISPVKSPSFDNNARAQTSYRQELASTTTGSTSSGLQLGRYSVSSPPSPPPIKPSPIKEKRIEAYPSSTKNAKKLPSSRQSSRPSVKASNQRYGMEKRSVSASGFQRVDGRQVPKR